jgi:hypothetical protein
MAWSSNAGTFSNSSPGSEVIDPGFVGGSITVFTLRKTL